MMEKKAGRQANSTRLALLPLRDTVIFPRMVVPLMVGRPASLVAVEESLSSGHPLFLCAQRDPAVEEPGPDDLYEVGVGANILQTVRVSDGMAKVVVEGLGRGRIERFHDNERYLDVTVRKVSTSRLSARTSEALMRAAVTQFEEYARLSQRIAPEVVQYLMNVADPEALSDLLCGHLSVRVEDRQELLETLALRPRYERLIALLMRENDLLRLEQKVRDRVREQMERGQREYYLHEQLRAIQQELGDHEGGDEFEELRQQIEKAHMSSEAYEKSMRELERYERMPAMSPEAAMLRTYMEWLVEMPWQRRTRDKLDLEIAARVLDEDHYGLSKVKERILEYLAVRKLSKKAKGPILCFVGPPGVGKTSLGRSIARAMGRKFVRVSLGGVRDEAEIRGHRRTYVGALPGRIIQNLKKVGVKNPLFMLDEVDKMSIDFRGDPSSALLEVLDPEQNFAFSDHYLEVDFDLHEVFFIATANTEDDIPHALHDRMEVVRLSGYTPFEKMRIARQFLIPKQIRETGLKPQDIEVEDAAVDLLIQRYTFEAGVRELERQIAALCRKVARKTVTKKADRVTVIGKEAAEKLLGPAKYIDERAEVKPHVGVAVGMAWTMAGGDILNVETSVMKGKGELTLTGQLGDVMKESAQAAFTYLRAHARALGIPEAFHKSSDVHVHVPEGAIPKDGPSAGLPLAVSMLSALRQKAPKALLAMTGEISLRGRVLVVGGVKEKVLAAHRSGIKTVILPKGNEKDLPEIPEEVRKDVHFAFVETMDEVFRIAFGAPRKTGTR
ncbi:MAG TPA: endopeptidase La [Candidatus Hydrogenedentes bacterium]|nr:endopeptidase La [Candidatus Hydrogenedentota bacterium]HPG69149.1 endopeptidase La [Candidatus Hydrogenedentota bacterium]